MAKVIFKDPVTGFEKKVLTKKEKAERYRQQLRSGYIAETGMKLTSEDRAFRSGFLKLYDEDKTAYMASQAKKQGAEAYSAFKAKQAEFKKKKAELRKRYGEQKSLESKGVSSFSEKAPSAKSRGKNKK